MKKTDLFDSFLKRCQADQAQLRHELRWYPPTGPMRLWTGQSKDEVRDITDERIAAINRELGRIQATIDFAKAVAKAL